MNADRPGEAGFPTPNLDSAVLFDFDDLVLSGRGERLLSALVENLLLLHRALDGAALVVSGLTASDLDAALAPLKVPMIASMGWERRWRGGETIDRDEAPSGAGELYEQLTPITQGPNGSMVRMTPSGVEADFSEVARQGPDVGADLRRVVSSRPGFRVLNRGWRYQIVPLSLRKDHLIELVADHANFRHRQLVHIADNAMADDSARLVRSRGGVTIRIARAGSSESRFARNWNEILSWLRRAGVSLSTARGHVDGFDG